MTKEQSRFLISLFHQLTANAEKESAVLDERIRIFDEAKKKRKETENGKPMAGTDLHGTAA